MEQTAEEVLSRALPCTRQEPFWKKVLGTPKTSQKYSWLNFKRFCSEQTKQEPMWGPFPTRQCNVTLRQLSGQGPTGTIAAFCSGAQSTKSNHPIDKKFLKGVWGKLFSKKFSPKIPRKESFDGFGCLRRAGRCPAPAKGSFEKRPFGNPKPFKKSSA